MIVEVAKANSVGADLRLRALLRRSEGAYDDITQAFPKIFNARPRRISGGKAAAHTPEVRRAVIDLFKSMKWCESGAVVDRDELQTAFLEAKKTSPGLSRLTAMIGGKFAKTKGTLAHEIALMNRDGLTDTTKGNIRVIDLDPREEDLALAAE